MKDAKELLWRDVKEEECRKRQAEGGRRKRRIEKEGVCRMR